MFEITNRDHRLSKAGAVGEAKPQLPSAQGIDFTAAVLQNII